ncbi:hypothetical protein L210DRAFT_3633769 [Boletus edulis BED1]|uniref:DUF6699 domain-containing protein n=1 Tax=Boletus edulis BED1 TaxID=1328754 RepID=A0AAD4BI47_BOLED|nr:hypothetical protein L210DRAFT_3635152 [Boletus edulis BED1]KAF8431220.1 hypothetical protein L210DRAFT_3633769 [Boletus edulis BED1]
MSSVTGSMHSHAGSTELKISHHPTSLHMHPLFASTRLHSAHISYNVTYTPSSRTVLDRTTHTAVPAHTLSQPATDPQTPAASHLVLRTDKFPWPVIVGPSTSSPSGTSFYIASDAWRESVLVWVSWACFSVAGSMAYAGKMASKLLECGQLQTLWVNSGTLTNYMKAEVRSQVAKH